MEVRECKAASQALDELASGCSSERPYSLIVLGDQMPDSDEFLTASGMNPPATRVPIVMLTSKRKPGDNKNIERIGAAGYIETPIVRADLLRLIWDLLPDSQMAATPAPAGISDTSKGDAQRGLKILVAEDSADNRVLVEAYLHRTAHHLTFVDDGQKAVDRLTMEHFDLVLMDMQMPVMDGLAATRAIRLMEQQTSRPPTPVIALTANARQEDRVLSSQAGCNAHLSKPISKQRLLAAIAPYTPAGPVAAPTPAPIEIAIPEGLEALVPGYLEARKREVPEMLALLAATDFERLRRLGHNLKGTGESYGFAALTKFGAALEDAARNSNRAAAEVQVAKIGEYCSRVALVSESPTEE
jgi:CheY-like chemotaxis protein